MVSGRKGLHKAEHIREAAKLGDTLLKEAGSVAKAAEALRHERHAQLGNALEGVLDMKLAGWVEQDHLEYLREAAENGVRVRREGDRRRMRANPPQLSSRALGRNVFQGVEGHPTPRSIMVH